MEKHSKRTILNNLLVYGSTHALIDASCIAVLFSLLNKTGKDEFFALVVTYNVLAFGLQALIGLEVDKLRKPRPAALAGCVLTAFAVFSVAYSPLFSIVLAGVGNALFHVGGGSISLNLTPKKAAAPGVYVAPGALGVTAGILIGTGGFVAWPFVLLLAVSCAIIVKVRPPIMDYEQKKIVPEGKHYELVIVLLLLAVMVRSLIGMVMVFPWKTDYTLLWLLTIGVVAGKALGGIIGDRFGWLPVAVATLILSAPLLAYGAGTPYLAIIGMFLFQATMPITLTAVSNMLPGRPGFAFGLTCLALIIGALPAFTELKTYYSSELLTLITIILTAVALYIGLKIYSKNLEQWIG